jgi:hypothetical protein
MRRHGCNDWVMTSKSAMEKDLGVNVDNVTDMWNSLPVSIVDAPSISALKNRLDEAMQEHMFSLELPSKLRTRQ